MFCTVKGATGAAALLAALLASGLRSHALAEDPPAATAPDFIETTLQTARGQAVGRLGEIEDPAQRADTWGGLGMVYHANDRLAAAEDAYRRALAEAEASHWHYLLAVVLADQGRVAEATQGFQRTLAVAAGPHMLASYRLGLALLADGRHEAARAPLQDALAEAPESAAVLAALGEAEIAAGEVAAGVGHLEEAAALEPEAGRIAYRLALAYRQLGNVEQAGAWLRRRNDIAPPIDDPLLLEVAALSLSPRFFADAGDRAWQRGDPAEAVAAWQRAATLAPGDAELGLKLAQALGTTGRDSEAGAEIERVLARHPQSARGWHLKSWLARQVDGDAAREAIERSLRIAENDAARAHSAALWMRAGEFMRAVDDYQQLVARQPDNASVRYWLAMAYLGAGACEAARPILAEAVRRKPDWGEAHIALARADAMCGDLAARLSAFRKADRLLGIESSPDTRLTLAFAELALGRLDEARTIAAALLPHPDAAMLAAAIAAHGDKAILHLARPFAPDSLWWLPEEVR